MIIKVSRGSDFDGLFAYLLRHGQYEALGKARIVIMEGVYDEQTASAQMTYNAALAPKRTRPVIHLMARAERDLTDVQYRDLATRMVRRARLEGHPFTAVVHDDGHVHVVACEMDDEGRPPARWLWHRTEKREVTDIEAASLPRGAVTSRAWDSHLSWRLTELAREVESEWGLVCLSSSSKSEQDGPSVDRWQQERLEKSAEVALQDRYYHQVRAALALKCWDDRIEALAEHGLTIRPHQVGGRVRGLQVQSLTRAQDFVKISAFGLGGMPKLDASADQPFLNWERTHRTDNAAPPEINLRKPEATFDPELARLRALFLDDLKAWNRTRGRRNAAFKRYARAKLDIVADVARFESEMSPHLSPKGLRNARREKRAGMSAAAKAGLATELTLAGPDRSRPIFIDFVKARAGAGDVGAAAMYQSLVAGVSETRRLHERKLSELAAAVQELRARAAAISASIKEAGAELRVGLRELADRADRHRAAIVKVAWAATKRAKDHAAVLAAQLAQNIDAAGHRIRVRPGEPVEIDGWRGDVTQRYLIDEPAHRPLFQQQAQMQSDEIANLSGEILARSAVRREGNKLVPDQDRLPKDVIPFIRWAAEQEVAAAVIIADRANLAETDRWASQVSANQTDDVGAAAMPDHAKPVTALAVRSAMTSASSKEEPSGERLNMQARAQLSKSAAGQSAIDHAKRKARADHNRLLSATVYRANDGSTTKTYLDFWAAALGKRSPDQSLSVHELRTIDLAAAKMIIVNGFSAGAVQRVIAERSPAESNASTLFKEALSDPLVRRAHDRHVETQDRRQIEAWLHERQALNDAGERFVDLWIEMLGERPIDPSITPSERNHGIDYEVVTAMLAENRSPQDLKHLVAELSPTTRDAQPRDRVTYAEGLMTTIADCLPNDESRRARTPVPHSSNQPSAPAYAARNREAGWSR